MCLRVVLIFFLNLIISSDVLSLTSDDLRVSLSDGSKLIGKYTRSHSGRPIKTFTNIPYAKPPVGHLRFKVNFKVHCIDENYSNNHKYRYKITIHRLQNQSKNGMENIKLSTMAQCAYRRVHSHEVKM